MDDWTVCRLCLQSNEDSLKALSDVTYEMITFSNIYFELVGITFTEYPTFPGKICSTCERTMMQAYKFRETCLETEDKLKELLTIGENTMDTASGQVPASKSEENLKRDSKGSEEEEPNCDTSDIHMEEEQDENHEEDTNNYRYVFEVTRKQMEYLQTKIIKCSKCERIFKGLDMFKKHTCEVPDKTEEELPATEPVQEKIEPLKNIICQKCDLQFPSQHALDLHMDDHKTEDVKERLKKFRKSKYSKSSPFKCEKCDRTFLSRNSFNLHMDRHNNVKRYACAYCDERFFCWLKRRTHVYKEHLKKSYIECSQCGKNFNKIADLNYHMSADHLKISYQCEVCGKVYRSQSNLSNHYRIHSEKVKCKICGKELKHILSLIDHMKIHGQAQKMKCPACSREVKGNVSLECHIRKVHPDKLHLIPSSNEIRDEQDQESSDS